MTQYVAPNDERPGAAFLTPNAFCVGEGLQVSEAFSVSHLTLDGFVQAQQVA